jgi:2-aminoadipate transaminase
MATPSLPALTPQALWTERLSHRMSGVRGSVIRELLRLTERPEVVSFAGGLPASEVFPLHEIEAATERVLQEHGAAALQYGATEGYPPLRQLLARHMSRYGVPLRAENIVVTTGSQQALDLVGRLFLDPGDAVACEEPTYLGAIQAWRAYEARFLGVPIDDAGMRIDRLEPALRQRPKFLYVLPNFQNPTGTTLDRERRRQLVELCERWDVPIVEDDPYGQLRYEGPHLPPLAALAGERVIYLGTLSKTLAPGLRLGWIAAPTPVIERIVQLKQGADLHTSTFTQLVGYETARGGFLDGHVRHVRRVYGERRDAMLGALERHFPKPVRWTHPQGGLFLWVTLPQGSDSKRLLEAALHEERIAFIPGAPFYPNGGGHETLRLNFSYCAPDVIEDGIKRLGRLLERA